MKLWKSIKSREYTARKGAGMLVGLLAASLGLLDPHQWNSGAGVAIFVWVIFAGVGTHVNQGIMHNIRLLNGRDDIGPDNTPRTEDGPWAEGWETRASREQLETYFRLGRELANWVEDKVGQ